MPSQPSQEAIKSQIIKTSQAYFQEAEEGRRERIRRNRYNREAYNGDQDFTQKIEGQSREFLPKTSVTAEQFSAFIKKGLVQFGDWFSVEGGRNSVLSDSAIRRLMMAYIDRLPENDNSNGDFCSFSTRLADASKVGLIESLMIFKVHGRKDTETIPAFEGQMKGREIQPWRLRVDLIPPEDYYPDPTSRGLYKIHRVERDLHDVMKLAEQGIYDLEAVKAIKSDFSKEEQEGGERAKRRPREDDAKPSFRKRIVIDEYWGMILDAHGDVMKRNVMWTVANEKFLIKEPVENPYWHGTDPFVEIPIIREPFSVWHKALYDDVVPLNLALNELFNLMLDGGLASVWGIRQVQPELLEDPQQVAGGVPQGKTLVMRSDAPNDAEVLKQVATGEVPADAMRMFGLLDGEFNAAARTNDLRLGQLPSKDVKATEIVEMQASQNIVMESIVTNIEGGLTKILRKAWMVILQESPNLALTDIAEALTPQEVRALAVMDAEDRFKTMAVNSSFKVSGLSETLTKAKDFQRMMAALQVASNNPVLQGAVLRRTDPDKVWKKILKMLNINPDELERDQASMKNLPEDLAMLGMQTQQGANARVPGEPGMQSEINQEAVQSGGV